MDSIPLDQRKIVLRANIPQRLLTLELAPFEIPVNTTVACNVLDGLFFLCQRNCNVNNGLAGLKSESPLPIWPGTMVWWEEAGRLIGPGLVIANLTDRDLVQQWHLTTYKEKGCLLKQQQIIEYDHHNIVRSMFDVLNADDRPDEYVILMRIMADMLTEHLDENGTNRISSRW